MDVHVVIYGVFVCFVGIFLSAVFSLFEASAKKASWLFVASNAVGFASAAAYLFKFSSQSIQLFHLDWLFDFSPSLGVMSAIFFALISGVSALVGVYGIRYLELYKDTYDFKSTQFLTASFVFGMLGVLLANNPFSFLLFWEVMSVASFFLVMADKTEDSVKAAFLYFIMTHLGASAILGGFLVLGKGSLSFDLASIGSATAGMQPRFIVLSFLLFFFGFGSKAGLVPFHIWLPEAHPQAPSNVSALMSGLMLKVAVYGFIRTVFAFSGLPWWSGLAVVALGIISGVIGALYAAIGRDMKRAFAYSSIENMGLIFMMLGFSLYLFSRNNAEISAAASLVFIFALVHAINHAFFKTALFLGSGVVISRVHTKNLDFMGGLAKIMPFFSFVFLIAILSSLPLPPFGTFYGEWGIIQNAISILHNSSTGTNALILSIMILSALGLIGGLAVFAMVKIFGISMLGLPRAKHLDRRDEKTDLMLIIPIFILAAAVLAMGIFAKAIISWLAANAAVSSASIQTATGSKLSSVETFIVPAVILILTYAIYSLFMREKRERIYHTWDCGQPIDSSMEYTATGFSAPIRFFFLRFLRRMKSVDSVPVVDTNPWIRKSVFSLSIRPVFKGSLYDPAKRILRILAERVKIIQSGRIQFYLLFLMVTLLITLLIAL